MAALPPSTPADGAQLHPAAAPAPPEVVGPAVRALPGAERE
jgi:hypothetical protein